MLTMLIVEYVCLRHPCFHFDRGRYRPSSIFGLQRSLPCLPLTLQFERSLIRARPKRGVRARNCFSVEGHKVLRRPCHCVLLTQRTRLTLGPRIFRVAARTSNAHPSFNNAVLCIWLGYQGRILANVDTGSLLICALPITTNPGERV